MCQLVRHREAGGHEGVAAKRKGFRILNSGVSDSVIFLGTDGTTRLSRPRAPIVREITP